MADTTEPTLEAVSRDKASELLDVLTLLHFAAKEANECTFDHEESAVDGMTCRQSRFAALIDMCMARVQGVIKNLDEHYI